METNENLQNETGFEIDSEKIESYISKGVAATEQLSADVSEATGNLELCPNCLEPNTEDLAVCKYCGMPLHQGADPEEGAILESEEELAANRAEAVPAVEKKPAKKQENGFRRVMPWLGLYLIYYAITGIIETSRQEELSNPTLAYASWAIYIVAGLLMAWPLIKKGYRKLRHLPDPDEEEEESTETTESEEVVHNDEGVDTTVESVEEDNDVSPEK